MPERRLTLRITTPEEGVNDPVVVDVIGAASMEQFQGKDPTPQRVEGKTAEECFQKFGAALDEAASR